MKLELALILTVAALGLGACSAKTTADSNFPDFGAKAQNAVTGPSLEGQWSSKCMINPLSMSGYRILQLAFKGTTFKHAEQDFDDAFCTQPAAGGESLAGTFSYSHALANGVFEIEYRIPMNQNVSSLRNLRISMTRGTSGDVLMISDWLTGFADEDKNVAPIYALKRVSTTLTDASSAASDSQISEINSESL